MHEANNQSVAQLTSLACAGDKDALAELLHRHTDEVSRRLQGKIARRWRSLLHIDDVMQITYLEAFLRIDRFEDRGPGSFQAWLNQIAQNNLRDAVRELQRDKRPQPQNRFQPHGDDSFVALWDLMGCTSTTPSRQVSSSEARQHLSKAMKELPADYATVVDLYDLQGRDIAAVASAIQRSSGAVHMLRARAHQRLRELMGAPWQFVSYSA